MLLSNSRVGIIDRIAEANTNEITELQTREPGTFRLQTEVEPSSSLWTRLRNDRKFKLWTGFEEHEILTLFRAMQPSILRHRKRGPQPKIPWEDALLLILSFYHLGLKFEVAAAAFGISATTLKEAVARIRPILHSTLTERWLDQRKRPIPLLTTNYPYIALLVDSMSVEVYRPKGRFEEAKVYWDGKHSIYALKKEVAILAAEPHYALFFQKACVGSIHDYEIHKRGYHIYEEYLLKTTEEKNMIPNDPDHRWAILMDKGYAGPESDTPGERRITLMKNATTIGEQKRNEELSQIRVWIECFFGRMQQLFAIMRSVYRWDHRNFDMDFENCALLTNEHIQNNQLTELDRNFYLMVAKERTECRERNIEKRKAQLENFKKRKKLKLAIDIPQLQK